MESPAPVRILTVCTGNVCRSPVAERLLQAGLDQVLPGGFEVRSAGTRALVGDPVQPLSADIIHTFGGTADGFAARQLTGKVLRKVDLVLAMSSAHRGEVLQLDASLLKRTFTIREFARMLDMLEDRKGPGAQAGPGVKVIGDRINANTELWRSLPARAASVRHLSLAPEATDNDVIDPYRRSADYYRQMEDELAPAIISILRFARLNAPA
ncbi:low molecular weight phosphatase family protein [Arthrobacter sp. ISL-28]|uniref:arsenate reductase/protein-tyrosine-phosphatase family protein n=1 Tax=Arthrobacter sp. ISL-28 TaxID=2819108 RepID=UPI001BE55F16|nr:low molecular weight phosphatase family protein [Arthrobacter sp. ISL-28]MBT2519699.1 low molecular weight phosphatase family protein [Arthrobacter sp. ISL-28]